MDIISEKSPTLLHITAQSSWSVLHRSVHQSVLDTEANSNSTHCHFSSFSPAPSFHLLHFTLHFCLSSSSSCCCSSSTRTSPPFPTTQIPRASQRLTALFVLLTKWFLINWSAWVLPVGRGGVGSRLSWELEGDWRQIAGNVLTLKSISVPETHFSKAFFLLSWSPLQINAQSQLSIWWIQALAMPKAAVATLEFHPVDKHCGLSNYRKIPKSQFFLSFDDLLLLFLMQ